MAESNDRWTELTRDLATRLAAFAPEWAEPVGSDPGVTIVDLIEFLGESLLTRADLSPQARTRLSDVIVQLQRAVIDCRDGVLARNRFFTGKLLTAADLAQELEYHRSSRRRHNRLLHGIGIVRGLDVSLEASPGGGDPTLLVSAGIAISPDGDELVVCEPVTLDVCQGGDTCHVTLGIVERPVDPTPEGEHTRIEESASVAVSHEVQPGHIAIARLRHDGGGWRVDSTFGASRARSGAPQAPS